ncbi:MAG: hypothetical protein JW999_04710 [Methanotrichaceae archaeon]|nr:hypothetical protein [Methanotrichaceae archaeon]
MIKRESLQKKVAIAVVAGMLMLLLAVSSVAQAPLDIGGPENCTDCSANASADLIGVSFLTEAEASGSPGLENAALGMNLSNAPSQDLEAPVLVSPSGILNTGKPTYVWNSVDSCLYYCLEVRNSVEDVVLKQWYDTSDFPSSTCSVTPSESLDPGDYTWSVLCWDCSGHQWSSEMAFTVCTSSSFPGKATLVSPKGTIGSKNPTFVWNAVPGCTQYCLRVVDAHYQSVTLFEECYDTQEVLSDQRCSVTPGLELDPGNYRWWIKTINCKGDGPWSNYMSFRYQDRPPGRSTPISPKGLITTSTPTFTWTAASLATEYHLQVDNDTENVVDEWFDADDVTKGFRCSAFLPLTLPDDDIVYYWRIQASNDAGEGSWSSYRYFETICPFKPGSANKTTRMKVNR